MLCYISDELARRVYTAFQNAPAKDGEEHRQIKRALAKAWEWGVLMEKGRESVYAEIDSAVNAIRQLFG